MPKIETGPSGPVVKNPKGESLDLTDELKGPEDTTEHGDTARATDADPALVDTSGEPEIKTEGDKVKEGHVSEVDRPGEVLPTAGELRKAGYVVPDHVKDKEVPSSYEADTPTPAGEVRKAGYVVPDHVKDKEVPSSYEADTPTPAGEVRLVLPDPVEEEPKKAKAVSKAPKNK
jgi:hypothetical protein